MASGRLTAPRVSAARWAAAVALAAAAAVLAMLALLPASPPAQLLSTLTGFAHLLAFSRILGTGLLVLVVGAAAIAYLRSRKWQHGRSPRALRALHIGAVALTLLAGAVFIVWPSGFVSVSQATTAQANGTSLTIAVFNSQDTLTARDLLELDGMGSPDIYVLPEAGEDATAAAVAASGLPLTLHATQDEGFANGRPSGIAPTTVLTRSDRSAFTQTAGPAPTSFGSVAIANADASISILGIHAAPPLSALMDSWRVDLATLSTATRSTAAGPTVIAGDFNATLRHGPMSALAGYQDASLLCAAGGVGTWPLSLPESLAAPIDHIFVKDDVQVQSCTSAQIGRGDHRAVIVTVVVP